MNKTTKRIARRIYLLAAELVDSDREEFSCNAVSRATSQILYKSNNFYRQLYSETMSPDPYYRDLTVRDITDVMETKGNSCDPRCRNFRVLLLCMMTVVCGDVDAN